MSLLAELQRRSVFKVAAAYLVVGWLVVQAASIAFPLFEAPTWALRVFVFVVVLGFPLALVIAWAVELTPEGLKLDAAPAGNKRVFAATGVLAVLAFAWFFMGQGASSGGAGGTGTVADARSIAVLPFVNMSGDSDNEYFSGGISAEILNALAQMPDDKVAGQLRATAATGSISVYAGYSIWDNNWSIDGATNLYTAGGSISLTSAYGADPYSTCDPGPCIAISADTAGTPSYIGAMVNSGAAYGGIDIEHAGNMLSEVDLFDYSIDKPRNFVEFEATGSISLGTWSYFHSNGGSIYIGAGGDMTAGMTFSGTPSGVVLYAGNTLTVNSPISTYSGGAWYPGIGLGAGSTINVNGSLYSPGDIGMAGGIPLSTWDAYGEGDVVQLAAQRAEVVG